MSTEQERHSAGFRRRVLSLVLFTTVLLMGFGERDDPYRRVDSDCLIPGEQLEYRVHYGFINAGEAILTINDDIQFYHGRPCYKIDIIGRSKGFFDFITRVRDLWGTYLDTAALIPHLNYHSTQEGKFKEKEAIEFDQINNLAIVHRFDKDDSVLVKIDTFKTVPNVQDIVSGYYYMRTFDFDTMRADEIFSLKGFFDDTTYTVNIKFLGREKLKTDIGEFDSFIISPIMPKNAFFAGKNPVKAWISDDKYRIPLKVKASLLIGSLEIDLRSYVR